MWAFLKILSRYKLHANQITDRRKWHKYDIDSLYMIWFSKRLWPCVSPRNNCTPPSLSASWVIPASPCSVLYVYVLKPRSWQQDKHFLAVVLDIVHDKWRAVRVVGRALFSYSTWFFQVVLFLLLALFVCFLFWQPVHETQRERERDCTIWGLDKCLSDSHWRRTVFQ